MVALDYAFFLQRTNPILYGDTGQAHFFAYIRPGHPGILHQETDDSVICLIQTVKLHFVPLLSAGAVCLPRLMTNF